MDIVLLLGGAGVMTLVMLAPIWWPFTTVPNGKVGVERTGGGEAIVQQGARGVQPRLLPAGRHFTLRRRIDVHNLVVIPDGCLGVVTSHIGEAAGSLNGALYDPRFGCFTDVEAFLAAGGREGVQVAVLPPGTYAIHPVAFEVIVLDNSDEQYTVYGRQSTATDAMALAEPNAVATPNGTAVAVYPDSDDNHATLAMLQVGDTDRSSRMVLKFVTSPATSVTIEWEVGVATDHLPVKELAAFLNDLASQEFDVYDRWSVAEFVAKLKATEATAMVHHKARITEAVMLPLLAEPLE